MSDTIKTASTLDFDFVLSRGASTATRKISVANPIHSASGISAAKAFRGIFVGTEENPFSIIDPKKFVQPAGWRDSDETEEEWTTEDVSITYVDTTKTFVDVGGGGGDEPNPRNLSIVGAADSSVNKVEFHFDAAVITPEVSVLTGTEWSNPQVQSGGYGDQQYYFFNKASGMTKGTVYIEPITRNGTQYLGQMKEFDIVVS